MKRHLRTGLGILTASAAIAAVGCDARPTAPPAASPAASTTAAPAIDPSLPDYTYESFVQLIENPDPYAVARTLGEVLPKLGPGSLPALQSVLRDTATLELNATEFELLMRYWARYDAPGATFYAYTQAPRAFRVAAILATLRPWAASDPQKALETASVWVSEGADAGQATMIALVRGWYDSGKPGLEPYIHDLGASLERQRALSSYATAMIRAKGPEEAVRWAESVSPDDAAYKLEVFRNVASALVPFDLDAAKRFCEKHCEGEFGSNMRDRIAGRWAERDPAAALEWVGTTFAGEERNATLRFTFANWARVDAHKSVAWMQAKLAEKPTPAYLEPIRPVYVRAYGESDPVAALALAKDLPRPDERDNMIVDILRSWRWRNEAEMQAWMKSPAASQLLPLVVERAQAPPSKLEANQLEQKRRNEATAPKKG